MPERSQDDDYTRTEEVISQARGRIGQPMMTFCVLTWDAQVALFRLVELSGGKVLVDGVDVSSIGLNDVRGRNMCIIPQDPLLFAGTLRRNMDPFNQHSEGEILSALEAVQMLATVQALPLGLDQSVEVSQPNAQL